MVSERSQRIKPFIAMDILEAAQKLESQGHSIISFSLGEPDFPSPECVQEACIQAIKQKKTRYTHSQGSIELRVAICEHYHKRYGVKVDPEQVIVTQGTSPAFFLLFSTLLERGDRVILPNPHYPCDANFVEFLDGEVDFLPIHENQNYQWDLDILRNLIKPQTKAIFVTSPSNPTGTVLASTVFEGLAMTKIPIVSDEIYHELVYDGEQHTILEFTKNAFVVNGFSKAYAMTGYRLGYVIAPPEWIRPMQKVHQNFHISANSFVQQAGITALKRGMKDVMQMREEFRRRRERMLKGLREIGFKINYEPEGAFYIFVDASHHSRDSYALAFKILNEAHVAITPGIDFGSRGEGYLRFSYATKMAHIEEGLRRLKGYFGSVKSV